MPPVLISYSCAISSPHFSGVLHIFARFCSFQLSVLIFHDQSFVCANLSGFFNCAGETRSVHWIQGNDQCRELHGLVLLYILMYSSILSCTLLYSDVLLYSHVHQVSVVNLWWQPIKHSALSHLGYLGKLRRSKGNVISVVLQYDQLRSTGLTDYRLHWCSDLSWNTNQFWANHNFLYKTSHIPIYSIAGGWKIQGIPFWVKQSRFICLHNFSEKYNAVYTKMAD